jgi:hypothetical protein
MKALLLCVIVHPHPDSQTHTPFIPCPLLPLPCVYVRALGWRAGPRARGRRLFPAAAVDQQAMEGRTHTGQGVSREFAGAAESGH